MKMPNKKIVLLGILERMLLAEYELQITAEYTPDGGTPETVTLFSGAPMYEYFSAHYGNYIYIYSGFFGAVESFRISWESFLLRNKNNIDRRYAALIADYNPLHNYDSTETESIIDETTHDSDKTSNATKTQNGTATDTGATEGASKIYGYNSTSGVNDSSATSTNNNTHTDNFTNTDEYTETQSDNTDNTRERELRRYGNIGVTTSAQMIQGELGLRTYDLAIEVIRDFAKQYLYAVGD